MVILAECFGSVLRPDQEFSDPVDERAALMVIAETIMMWRKSVSKS